MISVQSADICLEDGRPGCNEDIEFTRPWRNNCVPTKYWVCVKGPSGVSADALSVNCPTGSGFMDSQEFGLFGCVPWDQYVWTEPYDPPTLG